MKLDSQLPSTPHSTTTLAVVQSYPSLDASNTSAFVAISLRTCLSRPSRPSYQASQKLHSKRPSPYPLASTFPCSRQDAIHIHYILCFGAHCVGQQIPLLSSVHRLSHASRSLANDAKYLARAPPVALLVLLPSKVQLVHETLHRGIIPRDTFHILARANTTTKRRKIA